MSCHKRDTDGPMRRRDTLIGLALALPAFALYAATLLPGIGSGDTAEFQRVAPTLDVAHPTGYPLYTLLGWLWSHLPLGGTPAWRMNLFSALTAALAVGVVYLAARELSQPPLVAAAAALTLAASRTFWSQATIAEVYAPAALIEALLILALLRWRAERWPLWSIGLLLGLGLAHHRTIVLLIPGILLFLVFSHRWLRIEDRGWRIAAIPHRLSSILYPLSSSYALSATKGDIGKALLALLAGCLLYLYIPLRAPSWLTSWPILWQHIAGAAATSADLDLGRLRAEGAGRALLLLERFIWPQLLPIGALLALLGAARALWKDRALAALLQGGYLAVFVFCAAYFVDDVDVFLISAHLIAALLLGEGATLLLHLLVQTFKRSNVQTFKRWSLLGIPLLAIPALLVARNIEAIRAANTGASELLARRIMAQPLPQGSLVVVDWEATEGLRYLQSVEGRRPDLEVRPLNASEPRGYLFDALARNRALYLLRPWPDLGLAQWPEGALWRVGDRPPALAVATAADIRWTDGIELAGYTLPAGPYRPGEIVPVTLAWQALEAPRGRYTLFVHLVAADGTVWGQHDREPASVPTDQWHPGQRALDLYGPTLSPAAPPGRYRVVLGWYEFPSLRRLPLAGQQADDVTLGEVDVVPESR